MRPLTMLALFACAYALWARRSTWGSKWDTAVTLGLAFQGLNLVTQVPSFGRVASPCLHYLLGVWNVDELAGHILYLGGLACVLYMAISRLKLTDQERRRMLRTRIELPATFIIPVAVFLFVYSVPHHNIGALAAEKPVPAMCGYWLLIGGATIYLSWNSIWALRIISRNPSSRSTARVYIMACSTSIFACAVGVFDLMTPVPIAAWSVVRIDLLIYAWAGVYSWNQRRHTLAGKKLEPA